MTVTEKATVLNPMGYPPKVTPRPLAPRPETLDGKKVFLVDPYFDDSDVFLAQLEAWFADNMPSVETETVLMSTVYTEDDPQTWARIKAEGDAAIIGVGH